MSYYDAAKAKYNELKDNAVELYNATRDGLSEVFKECATTENNVVHPITRGQFYKLGYENCIPTIRKLAKSIFNGVKVVCTFGKNQDYKDRFKNNFTKLLSYSLCNSVILAGIIMPERTNLWLRVVEAPRTPAEGPSQ